MLFILDRYSPLAISVTLRSQRPWTAYQACHSLLLVLVIISSDMFPVVSAMVTAKLHTILRDVRASYYDCITSSQACPLYVRYYSFTIWEGDSSIKLHQRLYC